jgi:hypothetical protein
MVVDTITPTTAGIERPQIMPPVVCRVEAAVKHQRDVCMRAADNADSRMLGVIYRFGSVIYRFGKVLPSLFR